MNKLLSAVVISAAMVGPLAAQDLPLNNTLSQEPIAAGEGDVSVNGGVALLGGLGVAGVAVAVVAVVAIAATVSNSSSSTSTVAN